MTVEQIFVLLKGFSMMYACNIVKYGVKNSEYYLKNTYTRLTNTNDIYSWNKIKYFNTGTYLASVV